MIKKIIKAIAFVLIFLVCFTSVQTVLEFVSVRDSNRVIGFFEEDENSLDAVFLGSSATYAFWCAPVGFAEHGITVYTYSTASQPLYAAKFMIADAIKTQPDAVYIVNISNINENYEQHLQKLLIDYPFSINKLRMTDYLCDMYGLSLSERMEFYFPIIRFHDRWSEVNREDFFPEKDEYKCANIYKTFLKTSVNVGNLKYDFETKGELTEKVEKCLTDLLDFCQQENVKLLFYVAPQKLSRSRMATQNAMIEMVEERGFNVLDLRKQIKDIGLDSKIDYYNKNHTNIHGSIKVTDYISRYLIENYALEDKRGQEEYSDWTEAAEKYYKKISKYLNKTDKKILKSLEG